MWRRVAPAWVALAIAFGCGPASGPAEMRIRSDEAYEQALSAARDLSVEPIKRFGLGQAPDEGARLDLVDAGRIFDALIEYRPTLFALHFGGGQIAHALGEYQKAETRMRQAIALAPNPGTVETKQIVADAWFGLSSIELLSARAKDAEASIREALRMFPDNASYWAALASVQIERRNLPGARASLARSLRMNPHERKARQLDAFLRGATKG